MLPCPIKGGTSGRFAPAEESVLKYDLTASQCF